MRNRQVTEAVSRSIDALARFARLLATAPTSTELQTLLVDTAVELLAAAAAVLVQLDEQGRPGVVAQRGFGDTSTIGVALDDLGAPLGEHFLACAQGRFAAVEQLPLVAGGGLYGVLVLFDPGSMVDDEQMSLAAAVVDITASTLLRAKEREELERAYEELKASRRALGHAEKLRAIGGMAAGIAHDLKNVVGPLLMQIEVLSRGNYDVAAFTERVQGMRRPLQTGLGIVERLRAFSKLGADDESELTGLHSIIDDAVGLCRPRAAQAANAVALVVEAHEAPRVRVEIADAVAAVTNLVLNAIDAVADCGGTVTVVLRENNGGAAVEVIDDGPGVPDELRDKIFESFFTTKGKEGTGLGLAMVKELAQRRGGTLKVASPPEGGARFTLWLPAAVG